MDNLSSEVVHPPKRSRRVLRRLAATALGLCLITSGCSAVGPEESAPRTSVTTTFAPPPRPTETTLSPDQIQKCLEQGLYFKVGEMYHRTPDKQCEDHIKNLAATLKRTKQYANLPAFADERAYAIALQDSSGIKTTALLDATTLQTMAQEAERIKKPPLKVDCSNPERTPNWDRKQLVDHLAQTGAFSVKYRPAASRSDLLDPTKSTDRLVKRLAEVTFFAMCNSVSFNLLDINTGHSELTKNGNRSQHVDGDAFDIRPMNGTTPMPAWSAQPDRDPLQPEHHISNNPQALAAAVKLMDFLAQDSARYSQVIWSDSPFAINGSRVIPGDYDWSPQIEALHHDHIHIGINRAYPN